MEAGSADGICAEVDDGNVDELIRSHHVFHAADPQLEGLRAPLVKTAPAMQPPAAIKQSFWITSGPSVSAV